MNYWKREKYLDQLISKADELGYDISNNKLISNFFTNYEFYNTLLEKSMADGMISVADKVDLYKYRAKIVTDHIKLLKEDEITDGDVTILIQVLKIIDEMRENEEDFPSLV